MAKRKSTNKTAQKKVVKKPTKKRSFNIGKLISKKNLLVIGLGLSLVYFFIFKGFAKLDDSCFIGGDTWEYQSMAVNFAHGHGLNKFGAFEPMETYKFTWGDESKMKSYPKTQRYNFRRTPGYPVFLGMVYKIFGVDVAVAKHVQLFLIALIAGFLPFFGFFVSGKNGALAGLLASPFAMATSYGMSELIMTEALTAFVLFVILFPIVKALKDPKWIYGLILGLAIALGLFVKGALIFIPILLSFIFIYRAIREKSLNQILTLGSMLGMIALLIIPWSKFATANNGNGKKTVFLSTQSNELMLDCNNELTTDGSWHPEWRKDKANKKNYFHHRKDIRKKSSLAKVRTWYTENPNTIWPTFKYKLIRGFQSFPYLWLTGFGMLFYALLNIFRSNEKLFRLLNFAAIGILIALAIWLFSSHEHQFNRTGNIFGKAVVSDGIALIGTLLFCVSIVWAFLKKENEFLNIPLVFYIVLANFILLTLLFYGSVRFIKVADFLFVFAAFLIPAQILRKLILCGPNFSPPNIKS